MRSSAALAGAGHTRQQKPDDVLLSRLQAQSDRIRNSVAAEDTTLDDRYFVTEDRLWSIWGSQVGNMHSRTELDEFQQCVPALELARKMCSALKTISILICINWHKWGEFAHRFCRLTNNTTLDDIQDLDSKLPFTRKALRDLLFPENLCYADNFFRQQYVFLPLVLQENEILKSYEAERRLPLLDDAIEGQEGHIGRILPVKVAAGYFEFARGGGRNSRV
jgi:hypothetical protein